MKKPTIEINSYIDSPLANIVRTLIHKISSLRLKYPLTKSSSAEFERATQQMNAVEQLLVLLNENILPQFDEQQIPGLLDFVGMIKDVYNLKNLYKLFLTRKMALSYAVAKVSSDMLDAARKENKKNPSISVNQFLLKDLEHKKEDLIKEAAKIPDNDNSINFLFEEIKNVVTDLALNRQNQVILTQLQQILYASLDKEAASLFFHPMTFELTVLVAELMAALPKELMTLIPFFNPKAVEGDFHSGATGWAINKVVGNTFKLEPLENKEAASELVYGFTTYQDECGIFKVSVRPNWLIFDDKRLADRNAVILFEDIVYYADKKTQMLAAFDINQEKTTCYKNNFDNLKSIFTGGYKTATSDDLELIASVTGRFIINASISYSDWHGFINEYILFTLLAYVKANADMPAVNEAISGSELLKTAITQAKNLKQYIDDGILPIRERVDSHFQSCQLEIDYQLKGLQLIHAIDARIQEGNALFNENDALQQQLDVHYSQNTAYPDYSWDVDLNVLKITAYKEDLSGLITWKKREVNGIHNNLKKNVKRLESARSAAVTAWGESIFASYLDELNLYKDKLVLIVNESNHYETWSIKSTAKKPAKRQNISTEALEREIKHLEQKSITLEEFKTKFIQWSNNYLPNCAQQPSVLGDESLQQKLTSLKKQLNLKELDMQQQIDLALVEVNKNNDEIQNQLSTARFASVLSSANPEQMKQLRDKKTQALDELNNSITCLVKETAESELNFVTKNKTFDDTLNTKQQEISGLLQDNQKAIKPVRILMEKYHNPEDINGWSEIKTGTDDECIQWILSADLTLVSVSGLIEHSVYEADLFFLESIRSILEKNSSIVMPYKVLDLLAEKTGHYTDKNWLLTLLGMDDLLIEWQNYLTKQKNLLDKPTYAEYSHLIGALKEGVKSKKQAVSDLYSQQCHAQDKNKLITELLEHKKVINNKHELKSNLEKEHALLIQTQLDESSKSSEKTEQLKARQVSLEKDREDHIVTIEILNLVVNLLDEINVHGTLINSFKEEADDLLTLSKLIVQINLSQDKLLQKTEHLSERLGHLDKNFENIAIYQTKKEEIQSILESFDKRIEETLGKKYGKIYFDPIANNQDAYTKLHARYLNLISPDNKMLILARGRAVKGLLIDFNELSTSMIAHDEILNTLHDFISNPSCDKQKAVELQTNLYKEINALDNTLKLYSDNQRDFNSIMQRIAKYTQEHVELGEQAMIFSNHQEIEFPEASHQALTNKSLLDAIDSKLSKIADDETLFGSKESILDRVNQDLFVNALTELQKIRTTVFGQLQLNKGINVALEYRIRQRGELVTNLMAKLTELNGQISPAQRLVLDELLVEMNNYQELGESTGTLEFIRINRQQFVGTKLQLVLNQLTVAITDLDRQKPTDYSKSIQYEIDFKEKAEEILASCNDGEKLIYANKIKELHNQIQKMQDFGQGLAADDVCRPIVIELVEQLKNDTDRFVALHAIELPNLLDYQRFEAQFAARLNSQDDEMSSHWSVWGLIVANTLIALTIVGAFVLGAQLIHSKLTTGQFSFFFEKSKGQQMVHEIGESVKEILEAPPVLAV